MTPFWHTHQDGHVDQRCKPDGKRGQEQALMGMAEHRGNELRIEGVPQGGKDRESHKEDKIGHKENDGDDSKPVPVVWQLMEHD